MQVMRQNLKSKLIKKSIIGISGLAGLSSLLILPLVSVSSASASDSLDYNVNVRNSLNITVSSDNVSLNLNPGSQPYDSTDLNVSVGTNNPWGYRLYLKADTTDLTNTTYTDPAYINTLSGTATGTSTLFPVNKWGYRISSLSSGNTADSSVVDTTGTYFYPFVSDTLIGSSTTSVNDSASTLTFASKVNYEKPAGTYTLDFSFRAVPKITTLSMQNLDPTVCTTDPTLVTDSRDGQTYAIARLADGNCWMLQNLKLGAKTESLTLTAADSNVSSSGFVLNNKVADGRMPYAQITDSTTGSAAFIYDSQAYYCADTYGCYYNSYTATAGSMTSSTGAGVNVDYSICPAGWSLPTSNSGGQFEALANAYGGTDAAAAAALLVADPTTTTENVNGQYIPGILLGGRYENTGAKYVGRNGFYWSQTSYSVGNGYTTDIDTSGLNPLYHHYKYLGLAVRCLLQES